MEYMAIHHLNVRQYYCYSSIVALCDLIFFSKETSETSFNSRFQTAIKSLQRSFSTDSTCIALSIYREFWFPVVAS